MVKFYLWVPFLKGAFDGRQETSIRTRRRGPSRSARLREHLGLWCGGSNIGPDKVFQAAGAQVENLNLWLEGGLAIPPVSCSSEDLVELV
jgi:hypothetical protein